MNILVQKIRYRLNLSRLKLYYLIHVQLNPTPPKKRILVLKNDSIGDYILFRNFLQEIKQSEKFKNYEIYYLTSDKMLQIVQPLDGAILNSIKLIQTFSTNELKQEIKYFKSLSALHVEFLIHPTFSPNAVSHKLVKFIKAKYKIGFSGDTSNQTEKDKLYYENYYNQLVYLSNPFSHEFEKSLEFFKFFIKQPLTITKPNLSINTTSVKAQIIICPGAQHKNRIWSLQKFGQLINQLSIIYPHYNFIIATGPGEDDLYTGILSNASKPLTHYKIQSIIEFIKLISQSSLVVCNDSSAAHIAVACNVNSVCISNGNHYARFVPYPLKYNVPQTVVLPQQLLDDIKNNKQHNYYFGSTLDINSISLDRVIEKCQFYLTKINDTN